MLKFNRLKDCVVTNKNVIVRVDINVPVVNGKVTDDTRIRAVIPTIKYLLEMKAKVIVISHFGRPEGKRDETMSISQLIPEIEKFLPNVKVKFVDDCIGDKVNQAISNSNYGDVIILENLRFYKEETKNDESFSRSLASYGNLYVNDAFSCSHRAHASIVGIPSILKSCAGFLMESELNNLGNLFENAKKPMMAVVGGSKVSTKIDLINSLMKKCKTIVVGGGMANTFIYSLGHNVGKSLCEKDLKDTCLEILENAKKNNCEIVIPNQVVVTKKLEPNSSCKSVDITKISDDDIIADIGPEAINKLFILLQNHKTLVWNGPLGAFEIKPFNLGTQTFGKILSDATKQNKIISVIGGGDVVSALGNANLTDSFTYLSTAGGAFLEWLEGKSLPGILSLS